MNQNKLTTNIHENHELLKKRMNTLKALKPYSLEICGTLKGANWINDSAATSMEKVAESFIQFEEPVIWITEVNSDDINFHFIRNLVATKVRTVIAVGEFAERLHNSLAREIKFYISASSWEEALQMGLIVSKENDNVLFSPGCRASEPFESYKDRGAHWSKMVQLQMNL